MSAICFSEYPLARSVFSRVSKASGGSSNGWITIRSSWRRAHFISSTGKALFLYVTLWINEKMLKKFLIFPKGHKGGKGEKGKEVDIKVRKEINKFNNDLKTGIKKHQGYRVNTAWWGKRVKVVPYLARRSAGPGEAEAVVVSGVDGAVLVEEGPGQRVGSGGSY